MDIQAKLTGFAMLGATWVMWVLVGLSIGGVAIALDRAIYLIRTSDNYRRLKRELLAFLRVGDVEAARERLAASRSVEAQVAAAGLAGARRRRASAEERIAGATQMAKIRMERRLAFLGTLGANAPFIGLLGTVIGIIRAFAELNEAAGKVTAGLMTRGRRGAGRDRDRHHGRHPVDRRVQRLPARDQDAASRAPNRSAAR